MKILDYIVPINNHYSIEGYDGLMINLNVSGNKIHELHLRVCSECENLMKSIIKKLLPKINLDDVYLQDKHKELCSIIEDLDENKKTVILQKLNKHADMPFCLDILDQKLGICDKMIEFSKLMEVRPGNQIYYLQPFLKNSETKYFPLRWEHYNKIKHDKINCYTQCTFRDLINSLGAYYMLINYFVLSVNGPVYQNGIIKSKIYKPTIGRLEYPETVWNLFAYFRDDRSGNYYKKVMHNGKEVIPSEYDDKTMEWLSSIIDEAERKHVVVNGITKRNYLKTENFFFYYSFVQYNLTHGFRAGQIEKDSCWRLIVQKNINLPGN